MTEPTTYCAASDIEDVFGAANVAAWADLGGPADETAEEKAARIAARIARAIVWASGYLDACLEGVYPLPLATVDSVVVDAVATLAGCWLYESRGVQDFDPETGRAVHRLAYQRRRAEGIIEGIKAGKLLPALEGRLPATGMAPWCSHEHRHGHGCRHPWD